MKQFLVLNLILSLGLINACNKTSSGSNVNEFTTSGGTQKIDASALPQALKSTFASPETCGALMQEGVVSLWAGYTDSQKNWGETDADCKKSGDEILCEQNNNFLFSGRGSNMGMEVPKVFGLRSTAAYACLAAARSIGLQKANERDTHSLTSTIEKIGNVSSEIASTTQSASDVYLITSVSTNKASGLKLTQKYFFMANGELFGLASRQEQKFNADTQVQTAEVHFPSAASGSLAKPSADSSL